MRAECVACSALFLAAQKHGHGLPHGWWEGCDVDWETLKMCCKTIGTLYGEGVKETNTSVITRKESSTYRIIFDWRNSIRMPSKVGCDFPLLFCCHQHPYTHLHKVKSMQWIWMMKTIGFPYRTPTGDDEEFHCIRTLTDAICCHFLLKTTTTRIVGWGICRYHR